MTILSRQSWPILGKNANFADMSLAKGLFPDRGFHYKKGTNKTNKQTN
jgi:hypothetical protein